MNPDKAVAAFRNFIAVIQRLRTPGTGCPWDLEQDHRTLRPFLIEETYEVLDAIDRGDDRALREELGDLLLQVVLHAQVAADRGAFSIAEVIDDIEKKMVRRHPHVFGNVKASGSAEVLKNWDEIKAAEAKEKGHDPSPAAALARLPVSLPALQRAQRLGDKAAKFAGHERALAMLLGQACEDFACLEREAQSMAESETPSSKVQRLPDEERAWLERKMGDLLFSICQLARRLGVSAEDCLRDANNRFIERFRE